MNITERIKQVVEESGLSKTEIARRCGVSRASVSQWVNGDTKSPTAEKIFLLAKATGVSAKWLTTGKGSKEPSPEEQSIEDQSEFLGYISPWDSNTPLDRDEVELPFFQEVELSAGHGSTQVIESDGPKLRFAKSTLRRVGVQPDKAACVVVNGTSMEPMLPSGTVVGVNLDEQKIKDGAIYAIDHKGMLQIKMLYRLAGGGIRIRSMNRDEYPDEDWPGDYSQQHIRVLGKIFWYSGLIF